jgi:hypothetical protein
MTLYPANYTLKVFDINSKKVSEHNLTVNRKLHVTNGNAIWNVKFDFQGEVIENENHYFLSESINKIREIIEPKGFRILIKGSDYDAAHSGMQADMSEGTQIYKLMETNADGKYVSYNILTESDINSVVTLEEQKKNKGELLMTRKSDKKSPNNSTLPKSWRTWWQKLFGSE